MIMIAHQILRRLKPWNSSQWISPFSSSSVSLPSSPEEQIQKIKERNPTRTKTELEKMKKLYTLGPRKATADFSALTRQYPKVPAIVEYATKELKIDPHSLLAALEESPDLCDIAVQKWGVCFNHLSQYGFSKNSVLKMITNYPGLLHFEENELEDSVHCWMKCQFGEAGLVPLLIDNPYFLNIGEKTLDFRFCSLRHFLEGRRKRVLRLLTNSPQVMFKNWDQVQNVIDYLKEPMRIPISQVARSGVFRYDLFHLRCRFLFLYRLGVYTIRSFKADPLEPPKHPPLTDIVDSHEEKFVYRVAKVSMIEYQFFKEILYKGDMEDDRDPLAIENTHGLINPYLVTDLRYPEVRKQKSRPPNMPPVVE